MKYTNQKNSDYPYMEGVFDRTNGHLICLIGYEYEDAIHDDEHLYIYFSDSYGEADKTCYRRYRWNQLKDCFKGTAYIIPEDGRVSLDPADAGLIEYGTADAC